MSERSGAAASGPERSGGKTPHGGAAEERIIGNVHDELLSRLTRTFEAARDPDRAVAMRAYMRDQFPFLGIPGPRQKKLSRAVLADLPRPTEPDLRAIVASCWTLPEREYQYFACDLLRRHAGLLSPGFLGVARTLVSTKSWWDTVDALAAHVVGGLVASHPALAADMDEWVRDEDMWIARTAILHQLRFGPATDADRLFGYCLTRADHKDFFIRKAIGWALREYGKTAPDAVRAFVASHRSELSPLSVREALKNL
jgi:3-methyladenine DNA glycosylase AlkD